MERFARRPETATVRPQGSCGSVCLSGHGRLVLVLIACILSCLFVSFLAGSKVAWADVQEGDLALGHTYAEWGMDPSEFPDVDARGAILETGDGEVLWSRNADTPYAMASTTKIMTCTLALENTPDLDAPITIPAEAATVGEASCGLVPGTTTTMRQLLTAMMLKSGNDAAVSVAVIVGGSQDNFVAMMNDKAAELGMTNTHFANPHGLDADGHYTTARDFATLARYAMDVPGFEEIVSQQSATVDVGYGPTTFENGNVLFRLMPDCVGIKTGTEDNAGYCLVACVRRGDQELYSVILGSSEDWNRFTSTQNLMEWGFSSFSFQTLGDSSNVVASVPNRAWLDKSVPLICAHAVTVPVFQRAGFLKQDAEIESVCGEVHAGDELGRIVWSQRGIEVASVPLVAQEDMKAPSELRWVIMYLRVLYTDATVQTEPEIYLDSTEIHDLAPAA